MNETIETKNMFPELKDPMHRSDIEFFGKWDEKSGNWSSVPILQYSHFNGLDKVKAQAQRGDYEKAKKELCAYFKNRTGVPEYRPKIKPETFLAAEMMREKIFSFLQIDSCVGIAYVDSQWDYVTVELSTLAKTYFLFDSDMDGSYLEIYSKENSENKPAVLEVETGGKTLSFPVIADTYISAGENRDTNYGDEPILFVREAAEAPDKPFGSKTARTYFRFDVSDTIDNVTAIRLKFYAKSSRGRKKLFVVNPANEKYFQEDKLVWSAHFPQVFNFKETGYIWLDGERMPTSHEMLWGVEYEWLNFGSRLYPAGWCVSKYLADGEEIYAYRALELLISIYTQRQSGIYPRILEGGWRTEYLCDVLFGTLDSPYATPEVLVAQLKYMYEHLVDLKDVVHAAANWESAIRVGFARICAYVPEIVPEGWWPYAKKRLVELFSTNTLTPSGAYLESCSGYIIGVVEELKLCVKLVEMVDGREDPCYQSLLEQYRRLTRYYFNMAMNCGCTLPWGDGGRTNIKKFAHRENEFIPNPEFEYFATDGKAGTEPNYYSVLYPDKAIAFLRSDWKPDGFSAMIHTDFGGNHAHYDDLSLDVCAYGSLLLVDIGITSYSPGSMMADVGHSTISHNTIEIDGKDQLVKRGGKPGSPGIPQKLILSSNRLFDFAQAGSQMIYPGFSVNRKVLFLHNAYWIVSDYIIPSDEEPHSYRQAWHPDAKNGLTIDPATKMMQTHYENGGANIYVVPADPELLEVEKAQTYMAHPEYREIQSDYIRYVRQQTSGPQAFDTVLYPVKAGESANICVSRIPLESVNTNVATALKIQINEKVGVYYSSNEEEPLHRRIEEYETDGQMGYMETDENGRISMVALAKAKFLKQKDRFLVLCESIPEDLGVRWQDSFLYVFTSQEECAHGIKVYSEQPIATVVLNGKQAEFECQDQVVTIL